MGNRETSGCELIHDGRHRPLAEARSNRVRSDALEHDEQHMWPVLPCPDRSAILPVVVSGRQIPADAVLIDAVAGNLVCIRMIAWVNGAGSGGRSNRP